MKRILKYSLKNTFVIICFFVGLALSKGVNAQIVLDTIIPRTYTGIGHGFKAVQISSTETKWFFIDTLNNTFSLYNMDFTPFMLNIAVPEPFNPRSNSFFSVLYISRTLFDCDSSNIEYMYEAPFDFSKTFRIMRTDGTILFQLDSANGPYGIGTPAVGGSFEQRPIINTSSGTIMFLQTYFSGDGPINVYSLCGELPENIFDFSEINQSYVQLFPNPTSSELTFKINPPDNMHEYELVIVDNSAREVAREKINRLSENYTIDVRNFNSGAYFFTLCTKTKSYQSGKFLITK